MKKDFGPEVRVSVSEQFSALHSFTSQMALSVPTLRFRTTHSIKQRFKVGLVVQTPS